ncbi:unnamed protein product, partial [Mesorhabditis belari]|uniref:AB hydrolase-1 domain-containing protein n=1 Tax=Mesorhabditis belari TaxID=2138241 RepID=A0AAF3EJA3_9BILA
MVETISVASTRNAADGSLNGKISKEAGNNARVVFSKMDYKEMFNEFKKAQLETKVERDRQLSQTSLYPRPSLIPQRSFKDLERCPVHNQSTKQTHWKTKSLLTLKWLGIISFVVCPPIPKIFLRKILFTPPPKFLYYYFVSTEQNGKRVAHMTASSAHKASRPLTMCLPYATTPHLRCMDVLLQIRRIQVDTVETSCGNHLAVVYVMCEKLTMRMKPLGIAKSPQLVIFAQPNSTDLGMCMFTDPNLVDIADFLQCDLLAFDYSGYGISTGVSGEATIYADMDAIWGYATEKLGYDKKNIILLGFSIGTAAVSFLAAKHSEVRALILFAPFTSFLRVLTRNPDKETTCKHDKFCTFDRAEKILCKTLICHGDMDGIIKPDHSLVLSRRIANATEPVIVNASHQTIFCDRFTWDVVRMFVLERCEITDEWNKARKMASETDESTGSWIDSEVIERGKQEREIRR